MHLQVVLLPVLLLAGPSVGQDADDVAEAVFETAKAYVQGLKPDEGHHLCRSEQTREGGEGSDRPGD